MGFHNYYAYLSIWESVARSGNGSKILRNRPPGYALLNDNTTVTAPWIEQRDINMTKLNEEWGRIVVNVSMAMPHAGVVSAAMHPINQIMQPDELDNQGLYRVHASVPSPVVHVLCAMMAEEDLAPFISENVSETLKASLPPNYNRSDPYLGGTPWDNLFRWGPSHGESNWPPVFPKIPIGYNTIVNDTFNITQGWGRKAIYLLGNSTDPDPNQKGPAVGRYAFPLCQIQVGQTPYCSTRYNASSRGATLEAICEDENDRMAYIRSLDNATSGYGFIDPDWPNIGGEWMKSTPHVPLMLSCQCSRLTNKQALD